MPDGWAALFNRAFGLYWKRATALHAAAPNHWLPPRCQHVALVTDAERMRPYFQPFHRNSWLLYAEDFDPKRSTPEFAVFLFLYAERLGLAGQIVPALHSALPYFLTLDSAQRRDFARGCKRTERPDAAAWQVLGAAQGWIRNLFHETLRKPRSPQPGLRIHRENGLIVPPDLARPLAELQQSWGDCANKVLQTYRAGYGRTGDCVETLGAWLVEHRPQVLVTGEGGEILWDPEAPGEVSQLQPLTEKMTRPGMESICQDLLVIDRHSRRFLASLRKPDDLVRPAPHMTEGGLSYIHGQRRLIGYDIGPGPNAYRLWEPSPPYERWMLGARTVHEWGHLAAESGWVVVPPERATQREAAIKRLGDLFDTVVAEAPAALKEATAPLARHLSETSGSFGQGLTRTMLKRIEDFMANLVARRFLSADEMDTYVRNNVASRAGAYRPGDIYMELIRLVYEYQYLGLSRIPEPRGWFFSSTWVRARFIEPGVVSAKHLDEMIDAVASLCACYELSATAFDFPGN